MLPAVNRQVAGARIELLQRQDKNRLEVELVTHVLQADAIPGSRTFLAVTESGLESAVRSGENRGRHLTHDFVVRHLIGPLTPDVTGQLRWRGEFSPDPDSGARGRSLAVFVQDVRSRDVLQALQTPVCESS
jgi:hypothetical protein